MSGFTPHRHYPIPTHSHSGLVLRINRAITEVDARTDITDRESGIAHATIAVSSAWLENGCSCSQCWEEYRNAIRLLVS